MANRAGGSQLVHRVICERTYGPPPSDKHEAAHLCGNGHLGCVNPRHLAWKTSKENKADQLIHGTRMLGVKHHNSKLTNDDVRKIISLRDVMFQREIGEMFGINQQAVSLIQNGKRWQHLGYTLNMGI